MRSASPCSTVSVARQARDWRHALVLSSNRPFGVSIMIDGGRKGYSEGSSILKWYIPPSNSDPGVPRMVQCHS